jgi:hypothetical protein
VPAAEALRVDALDLGVLDRRQPFDVDEVLHQVLERHEHAGDHLRQVGALREGHLLGNDFDDSGFDALDGHG